MFESKFATMDCIIGLVMFVILSGQTPIYYLLLVSVIYANLLFTDTITIYKVTASHLMMPLEKRD